MDEVQMQMDEMSVMPETAEKNQDDAITYNEGYLIEFKRDYYLHTKHNLDIQVKHLARLADYYSERFRVTGNWTNCIKAHGLFNSVAIRKPDSEGWSQRAHQMLVDYLGEGQHISSEQQREITSYHKNQLEVIREKYREKLKDIDSVVSKLKVDGIAGDFRAHMIELMRANSRECSADMINFTKEIICKSSEILDVSPPCDFSVLAIGSLAKGEATPYSDLEYLFLIESMPAVNVDYFERLALISYFLIGNLGETTLECFDIDELNGWFKDCAQSGFKIDGLEEKAGNIPTGNGRKATKNHFIVTPENLAATYKEVLNNPDSETAKRGDMTAMLRYTKVIYSNGKSGAGLPEKFIRLIKTDTQKPEARIKVNMEMLAADTTKFNFTPDQKVNDKGFTVDVKKELYRFPSILLLDLSILFDCLGDDAWSTLDQLNSDGHISNFLYHSLRFMLACTCYIRLSAYLFHDSHNERVSVAPKSDTVRMSLKGPILSYQKRWFIPLELYIQLCEAMMPIKQQLSALIIQQQVSDRYCVDLKDFGTAPHWLYKFLALQSAGRSVEALHHFNQNMSGTDALKPAAILNEAPSNLNPTEVLYCVSTCLSACSRFSEALEIADYLNFMEGSEKSKVMVSKCHFSLGHYETVIEMFSLEEANQRTASAYFELGWALYDNRDFKQAEDSMIQALQLYYNEASTERLYDYYGDVIPAPADLCIEMKPNLVKCTPLQRLRLIRTTTPDIIDCVIGLNIINWRTKDESLRRAYHDKVDTMLPEVYGDNALVNAAVSLHNIQAINYDDNGQYQESEDTYLKALQLYQEMYGSDTDHTDIAKVLCNLGFLYHNTGDYRQSVDYSKRALEMYIRVYGERSIHKHIIRVMHHLGNSYRLLGDNEQATEYYEKPLELLTQHNGPQTDHRDIANSLYQLGSFYNGIKQYSNAHYNLTKALEMYQRIHGTDSHHEDIAEVLFCIGFYHFSNTNYQEAVNFYNRALNMYKKIHGDNRCHVNMGKALLNIGVCYSEMEEYKTAKEYYLQALRMNRKIYGEQSNHKDIANTLTWLGDVNHYLGLYAPAESSYKESLQMNREIHGHDSNNKEIASLLNNLGANYKKKGEYSKSEDYLNQSLAMRRQIYGEDSNHVNIASVH